jgi:hypothetical protein
MHKSRIAQSVLFLLAFSNLYAGQVQSLSTVRTDGAYVFSIRVKINSGVAIIWPLIDDFTNLARMNNAIVNSSYLPSPDPLARRVQVKTHFCIWFFCKYINHVQDIVATDEHEVFTVILPAKSDFRAGWAKWKLTADRQANTSILAIDMALVPRFWIPPVIGPYLIKRKLNAEGLETVQGLERLIQEKSHVKNGF